MIKKLAVLIFLLSLCGVTEAAQYIPDDSISPAFTRDAEIVPTGEANAICISNTGTPTPAITLCSTVDLTGKTVLFKLPEYTVAALPATHPLSIVTNGTSASDCTVGGGAFRVLCAWNGAAWASIGGGGGGTGDVTDVLGTANEICITNSTGPQPQAGLCATVVTDGKTLRTGRLEFTGDITPTAITGNTADWNPTSLSSAGTIRASASAAWNLSGLSNGSDGRIITIYNVGSFPINFQNENAGSTAANRFAFGADISLSPNQGIILQYDSVVSGGRWRALSAIALPSDSHYCADAGSTDAYACTLSPAITSYKVGSHYFFKANTANTGVATLALNSLTATTIKKVIGGVTTDLDNNDIRVGQVVEVVYDGTNFQMISMLGNAAAGVTGGALTTGTIPKASGASALVDSAITEDADSVNVSKSIEVGTVGTNSWKFQGTGVTGNVITEFQTIRKKQVSFRIGSDTGSALVDTQDEAAVWENQIGAMHVTSIKCQTDTGTSTINIQRDDGSAANILSSNLVCSTSGATSSTFTAGEDAIAVGHKFNFVMVTAATSGTPKRISVTISLQLDSGA